MDDKILQEIRKAAVAGELACADAHAIAGALGVSPLEVGRVVNTTEIRINRCQLGLFGYGPKPEGKHKIVLCAAYVPDEIQAAIEARAANGSISCFDAWEIADAGKYPRLGIANIIEAMGLRVKPCQLGCF